MSSSGNGGGCRGICARDHDALISHAPGHHRSYAQGGSRCQRCNAWFLLPTPRPMYCPCCGCRLRAHARNKHAQRRKKEAAA